MSPARSEWPLPAPLPRAPLSHLWGLLPEPSTCVRPEPRPPYRLLLCCRPPPLVLALLPLPPGPALHILPCARAPCLFSTRPNGLLGVLPLPAMRRSSLCQGKTLTVASVTLKLLRVRCAVSLLAVLPLGPGDRCGSGAPRKRRAFLASPTANGCAPRLALSPLSPVLGLPPSPLRLLALPLVLGLCFRVLSV